MVHSNPLKVFVSNTLAANTGTTIPTIVNDDVLILDRALATLSADTIANGVSNDLIYVALGTGSAGEAKTVAIPVKGINKVMVSTVALAVQHKVKIVAANALGAIVVGQNYNIKLFFHDTHRQMDDREGRAFFSYTAKTGDDATAVLTGLAAKINAVAYNKQVSAAVVGGNLEITGLAVTDNAFGLPQFRYFDVALRSGFKTEITAVTISGSVAAAGTEAIVITPGIVGKGLGNLVKQQELAGIYDFNRTQWPLATDTRRAVVGGYYNLVTISYSTTNTSAFGRLAENQQTLVVAFKAAVTDGVTPYAGTGGPVLHSTKGQAFIDALEALTEGSFVAFVE